MLALCRSGSTTSTICAQRVWTKSTGSWCSLWNTTCCSFPLFCSVGLPTSVWSTSWERRAATTARQSSPWLSVSPGFSGYCWPPLQLCMRCGKSSAAVLSPATPVCLCSRRKSWSSALKEKIIITIWEKVNFPIAASSYSFSLNIPSMESNTASLYSPGWSGIDKNLFKWKNWWILDGFHRFSKTLLLEPLAHNNNKKSCYEVQKWFGESAYLIIKIDLNR